MFLYEARVRARLPRTGTSAAQLGTHLGMIGTRKGQKPKETHQEMTLDTVLRAPRLYFGGQISTHISGIGQALEPQKCWKYGQKAVQSHGTCTLYRVWPGRGVPNLSRACPAGKSSLETRQKEKRDPNDADDAGQGGQHHQHHWGSVSPFLASHAPNDPSLVKIVSHPQLPLCLGASFQNGPCS